jgi:hypothetical protein
MRENAALRDFNAATTVHSRLAVNNAVVLPANTTVATCKTHTKSVDPSIVKRAVSCSVFTPLRHPGRGRHHGDGARRLAAPNLTAFAQLPATMQ